MVKIISKEPVPAGLYYLEAIIGYGEHCDDMYTSNTSPIDDKNAEKFKNGEEIYTAGFRDYRAFFSFSEAEEIVKLVKRILGKLKSSDHIVLNYDVVNNWDSWYEEISGDDINMLQELYDRYPHLFDGRIDNNWYGLVDMRIIYVAGNKTYQCEITD